MRYDRAWGQNSVTKPGSGREGREQAEVQDEELQMNQTMMTGVVVGISGSHPPPPAAAAFLVSLITECKIKLGITLS